MRMKNLFVALAVFAVGIFGSTAAFAQSKQEKIEVIVNATNSMGQVEAMREVMSDQFDQQFAQAGLTLTPEQKEQVLDVVFDIVGEMIVEIRPAAVNFYTQNLNDQEVDELYAFYTSETGAKVVRLMPEAVGVINDAMAPLMEAKLPEMQARLIAILQGGTPQ